MKLATRPNFDLEDPTHLLDRNDTVAWKTEGVVVVDGEEAGVFETTGLVAPVVEMVVDHGEKRQHDAPFASQERYSAKGPRRTSAHPHGSGVARALIA